MFSDKYEAYAVRLRREFHRHPELSGKEKNTSERIRKELEALKLPYETVGDYGIIAALEGGEQGKTIALRADMDALPIQESHENLAGRKSVVSGIDGAAHLCGHDGHMAMLLAAAKALVEIRDGIRGTVLFCFEQGEEDGSGIEAMLEGLESRPVDGVWGIHLAPGLPAGVLSVDPGPRMAGGIGFHVRVKGKGGHGARPDQAIDPIQCTVHILSGLSAILTREMDPRKTGVLTVGKLHAGEAGNVIPETAEFWGSIRFLDDSLAGFFSEAFNRIVLNTASAHRCGVEIDLNGPFKGVVNHEGLAALAAGSVAKALGGGCLSAFPPLMASESMARYLERYPGVFAFLGIDNAETGSGEMLHNPRFDIDEACLKNGIAATVQFTLDFLGEGTP